MRRVCPLWTGPPTRRRRQPIFGKRARAPNEQPAVGFRTFFAFFLAPPRKPDSASPKKKTPAPEGARVFRRMGEGLGAGGHSTRRRILNARLAGPFPHHQIFFESWPAGDADGSEPPSRVAGRRASRRETPDNANGYAGARRPRHVLRSHSGCRPGTGPEDDLRVNPWQFSSELPGAGDLCQSRTTVPRHLRVRCGLL
jgi:hypothetical protein